MRNHSGTHASRVPVDLNHTGAEPVSSKGNDMFRNLLDNIRQSMNRGTAMQAPEQAAPVSSSSPLPTTVARDLDEYRKFYLSMQRVYAKRDAAEVALIGAEEPFETTGWCYVCAKPAVFMSDLLNSDGHKIAGKRMPNWRERMECRDCGLNSRIRASIHFLERNLGCGRDARIHIAEQSTPLYTWLQAQYPGLTGSEYFGSRIPFGSVDPVTGYRNESVTALTFADASLDYMLSFDVLEHVPDYQAALRECRRCLKPGGALLFSVPFHKGSATTIVQARIAEDGSIEHLSEPMYHGDPVNPEGCLCYYTFGWDILADLRALGFRSAEAHLFWAPEYGYLGREQILLSARL